MRAWQDVKLKLLLLFLLYLVVLFFFAFLYQVMYRRDSSSFAFAADIAASQTERFMADTERSLMLLRSEKDVLALLMNRLSDGRRPPVKDCGTNCVEYEIGDDILAFVVHFEPPFHRDADAPAGTYSDRRRFVTVGWRLEEIYAPPPEPVWHLECKKGTRLQWDEPLRLVREGDLPPNTRTLQAMVSDLSRRVLRLID